MVVSGVPKNHNNVCSWRFWTTYFNHWRYGLPISIVCSVSKIIVPVPAYISVIRKVKKELRQIHLKKIYIFKKFRLFCVIAFYLTYHINVLINMCVYSTVRVGKPVPKPSRPWRCLRKSSATSFRRRRSACRLHRSPIPATISTTYLSLERWVHIVHFEMCVEDSV